MGYDMGMAEAPQKTAEIRFFSGNWNVCDLLSGQ